MKYEVREGAIDAYSASLAGWPSVELGRIARVIGGSTPASGEPKFWNGEIVWVTTTDLGKLRSRAIEMTARQITTEGYASCGAEMIPAGSVVMSSRAPIGHLAIAARDLCTNQGCKSFVPSDDLDSTYLYFALKRAVPQLQELGAGATFAEVSKSVCERFEIPFPPLAEQKRIAAILTEQMAAVDKARTAAQAKLDALKALTAAYLREAFDGPEAMEWPRHLLGDVADVSGGIQKTPGRSPSRFFKRYLTVRNVQQGYLDLTQVETFEVSPTEFERLRLHRGDILIVEGNGSLDQIDRNALFDLEDADWIHQNHIIRVRFQRGSADPRFVGLFLNSPQGRIQMVEKARSTSIETH